MHRDTYNGSSCRIPAAERMEECTSVAGKQGSEKAQSNKAGRRAAAPSN